MGNRGARQPSLAELFMGFVHIGLVSFGGGLAAWTRREVVEDHQFISGYALSQLVPGATNVNLAVFIGTQLRGLPGAIACFWGLTLVPLIIVLILGALYIGAQNMPGGAWFSRGLSGMGAVAIGMNLGLGIRLAWARLPWRSASWDSACRMCSRWPCR
jgi:chromate transporter